ncbi:MAG: hypothetical protein ACK5NF_02715 [Bacilli bacterium]
MKFEEFEDVLDKIEKRLLNEQVEIMVTESLFNKEKICVIDNSIKKVEHKPAERVIK